MNRTLRALLILANTLLLGASPLIHAEEVPPGHTFPGNGAEVIQPTKDVSLVNRATAGIQDALDHAVDMLGIRYRRGGTSVESGFDCSGFVSHVFREGAGLNLPRDSKSMSKVGTEIEKTELKPGDLVFFNTMRRAFSHVGIYLGYNQFVHAPRSGGRIRIEDIRDSYWKKRYNGARRVNQE